MPGGLFALVEGIEDNRNFGVAFQEVAYKNSAFLESEGSRRKSLFLLYSEVVIDASRDQIFIPGG